MVAQRHSRPAEIAAPPPRHRGQSGSFVRATRRICALRCCRWCPTPPRWMPPRQAALNALEAHFFPGNARSRRCRLRLPATSATPSHWPRQHETSAVHLTPVPADERGRHAASAPGAALPARARLAAHRGWRSILTHAKGSRDPPCFWEGTVPDSRLRWDPLRRLLAPLTRKVGLGNLGFRSWPQLRRQVHRYLSRNQINLIFFYNHCIHRHRSWARLEAPPWRTLRGGSAGSLAATTTI